MSGMTVGFMMFGALMFLLVVIFTMLASTYFDPKLIWKNVDEEQN